MDWDEFFTTRNLISRLNVLEIFSLFPLEITRLYTGLIQRNSLFCVLSEVSTWSLLTLTPVKKVRAIFLLCNKKAFHDLSESMNGEM